MNVSGENLHTPFPNLNPANSFIRFLTGPWITCKSRDRCRSLTPICSPRRTVRSWRCSSAPAGCRSVWRWTAASDAWLAGSPGSPPGLWWSRYSPAPAAGLPHPKSATDEKETHKQSLKPGDIIYNYITVTEHLTVAPQGGKILNSVHTGERLQLVCDKSTSYKQKFM